MTNPVVSVWFALSHRDDGSRAFAVCEAAAHDFLVGSVTSPDTAAVNLMKTVLGPRRLWRSLPRDRLQKEYFGTVGRMTGNLITELIYISYRQREIHSNYYRPRKLGSSSALAACVMKISVPSPSVSFRSIGIYFNPTGEYPFIALDPGAKTTIGRKGEGRWSWETSSWIYPRSQTDQPNSLESTLHFFKTRAPLKAFLWEKIRLFKESAGMEEVSLTGDFIFLHGKGVNVSLPPQPITQVVPISRWLVHFEDIVVFEKSQGDMAGGKSACAFCSSEAAYRILRGEIPGPHRSLKLVIKGILEHCAAVAFPTKGAYVGEVCSIDRYSKRLRIGSSIGGTWHRLEVIVHRMAARSFRLLEMHRLHKIGGSPSGRVVAYLSLAGHATVISYEPRREYPWILFDSSGLEDDYRRRDGKKMGAAFYFFMESVSLLRHIQQDASETKRYYRMLEESKSLGRIELTRSERKVLAIPLRRMGLWKLTSLTLSPEKEGKLLTKVKLRQSRGRDPVGVVIARMWNMAIGLGEGERGNVKASLPWRRVRGGG